MPTRAKGRIVSESFTAIWPGLLALSDALDHLEAASPRRAQLVKLRFFAGFTVPEVAAMLGISQSTAEADWTYAKAWLQREMGKN